MSLTVNIPVATFEMLYGSSRDKDDEQIVMLLSQGIEEAFGNAMGIAIAESRRCQLKYLDITDHPFQDLGGWRELIGVTVGKIAPDTACFGLALPFADEAVEMLQACAPAFDIPQEAVADVVNALLVLLYSMNHLSQEYDQEKVKPVIRGLEADLAEVLQAVSFPGMGGIVDTPASVDSREVWGHSQNRPDSIPVFVIF